MTAESLCRAWTVYCMYFSSSYRECFPVSGFKEFSCVSSVRYHEAMRVRDALQDALAALGDISLSTYKWRQKLPDTKISENKNTVCR